MNQLKPCLHSRDCAYLKLNGEQGIFNPEQLKKGYREFIESPYKSIMVDFGAAYPENKAHSYDTSIAAEMIRLLRATGSRGGNLKIILEPNKRKIFHLSRLEKCFKFIDPNQIQIIQP